MNSGTLLRIATACVGVIASTWGEEFSNSFALDIGPKDYRIDVTGNDERAYLSGTFETNIHATWMLRLWDNGFESPGFLGGLGLAYGLYEDGDIRLQVFEMRGDFGPAVEPVSWMRIGMLFFGGTGYHDLNLPRAVFDQTTVGGAGMWGFSYGANAFFTLKPLPRLQLSAQGGIRGLYASYGVFEDGDLERGIECSTIGLLAGASIDFSF
jgi:hypothetical protein